MQLGDKVVCVDDCPNNKFDASRWNLYGELPKRGRVYVVIAIRRHCASGTFPGCTTVEIIGTHAQHRRFPSLRGFDIRHFRLLNEMKEETRARREAAASATAASATLDK